MFDENSLTVLLASFFYDHGYLDLPELGRFELKEGTMPAMDEHQGHRVLPPGSISFTYNPREQVDPELIGFITSRSRKMKALAISDLGSMADAAKEMLNLGQSYTFTGIATILPSTHGNFEVVPDRIFPNLLSDKPPSKQTHKTASPEMVHQGELNPIIREGRIHSPGERRTIGSLIITGICVVIVALLVYFLFFNKTASSGDTLPVEAASHPVSSDTAAAGRAVPVPDDGLLHYEVVFEHANRERALQRYRQLTGWGHRIILRTKDSVSFNLAVPVASLSADTTAVKDSIQVLYGHPVYIRYLSRQ
ncbi:MAG TPA: hypothetical protein VFX43_10985 [Chitinophagaceae bacterium]|nr:hypothetical protein [Chitinophagaceae bacterium]